MALVSVGRVHVPRFSGSQQTPGYQNATVVDAASEGLAWVVRAPKAGEVKYIHWRPLSGAASGDLTIGIKSAADFTTDHDASCAPVTITLDTGTAWRRDDLTDAGGQATCTVAVNDEIAVVFQNPASGQTTFTSAEAMTLASAHTGFAYRAVDPGTGSWTRQSLGARAFPLALEYSDGTFAYIDGCFPASNITSVSFNSGTAFNSGTVVGPARGLRFQVPFKARCSGAWVVADMDGDGSLQLVSAAGAVLASATIDNANRATGSAEYTEIVWSTGVTLDINTTYYVVMEATEVSNIGLYEHSVSDYLGTGDRGLMDAFPGWTREHYLVVARADMSEFATNTLSRPYMGLVLDQLDDGAGSGGSMGISQGLQGIGTGIQA